MAQSLLLSCSFATGEDELHSYAPSIDVASGPFVGMPEKEFTKEEIQLVVKQYGDAAKRCQKAGIDIIEIHAGIGYMVMRFISKYSNHRTDEYGGDTKGRCKLLTDIIDEIHKQCGEDYPMFVTLQTTLCPAVSALKTSRRSSRL